jgi:hypothetical protein
MLGFLQKFGKNLALLTQNNAIITLVFEENAKFFTENRQK